MLTVKHRTQDGVLVRSGALPRPAPFISKIGFANLAYTIIRIAIGVVFVWSGAIKLMDHRSFAVIIEAYGLIPEATVVPVSLFLATVELLAGLGLIWDIQGALGLITGMLLFFMTVLGYGLWMGLDVECGCFGPEDPEAEAYHGLRPALYRDMILLAGLGYLFAWRRIGSVRPRKLFDLNDLKLWRI